VEKFAADAVLDNSYILLFKRCPFPIRGYPCSKSKTFYGCVFTWDLTNANRQLHEWVMGRAGNRIHGTTKQKPLVRFAEMEKDFLRHLPDIPPELACWASVKLHGNKPYPVRKSLLLRPAHAGPQVSLAACNGADCADLP
jgi:hypothetical protein